MTERVGVPLSLLIVVVPLYAAWYVLVYRRKYAKVARTRSAHSWRAALVAIGVGIAAISVAPPNGELAARSLWGWVLIAATVVAVLVAGAVAVLRWGSFDYSVSNLLRPANVDFEQNPIPPRLVRYLVAVTFVAVLAGIGVAALGIGT
jgi:hypothetical protein